MPKNTQVFMDFTIGSKAAGRVVFELFYDITPLTAENFRGLCTGEYGQSKRGTKLHYLGNRMHRMVQDFMIQGGDISRQDGSGGDSIYSGQFKDENFQRRHAHAGVLSMANCGADTNTSQFFITLKECPHLDGKHVVFGQVVEGMDVIRQIAKVPTDMQDKPRIPIHIFDCGQESKSSRPIDDPENKPAIARDLRQAKTVSAFEQYEARKLQSNDDIKLEEEDDDVKEEGQPVPAEDDLDALVAKLRAPPSGTEVMDARSKRKADLLLKMNQALRENNKAVIEEQERVKDPNYERKRNKDEYFKRQKKIEDELEDRGLDKSKKYLFETAIAASKQDRKRQQKAQAKEKARKEGSTFGWDMFNTDSLYRAYDKRVERIPKIVASSGLHDMQGTELEKQARVEMMAKEVEDRIEQRNQFSRRRTFNDDADVSAINDRNERFNKKLERNYSKYAAEIKSNLERGTAL